MFTLNNHLGLFVPSTSDIDRAIGANGHNGRLELVQSVFSLWFGSTSTFDSVGTYVTDSYRLVKENNVLVVSWCTKEAYGQHYSNAVNLAAFLSVQWSQECIALLDNGKLHLIDSTDLTEDPADLRQIIDLYNSNLVIA